MKSERQSEIKHKEKENLEWSKEAFRQNAELNLKAIALLEKLEVFLDDKEERDTLASILRIN